MHCCAVIVRRTISHNSERSHHSHSTSRATLIYLSCRIISIIGLFYPNFLRGFVGYLPQIIRARGREMRSSNHLIPDSGFQGIFVRPFIYPYSYGAQVARRVLRCAHHIHRRNLIMGIDMMDLPDEEPENSGALVVHLILPQLVRREACLRCLCRGRRGHFAPYLICTTLQGRREQRTTGKPR